MDILELVMNQLNDKDTLVQLGKKVGANSEQVKQIAQLGLPTIMKALSSNASTPNGAKALAGALEQHQDDETDDLMRFLKNVNIDDGQKILQHVFANNNQNIQSKLAQQVGLDANQVSGIMSQLAPLLLGTLGKQKKNQNIDATNIASLTKLLTNNLGKSMDDGMLGMVSQLLDSDKDGDIMDDVSGMIGSFFKNKK